MGRLESYLNYLGWFGLIKCVLPEALQFYFLKELYQPLPQVYDWRVLIEPLIQYMSFILDKVSFVL